MPVGEIYIKLVVGFPRDPKVRALARYGEDAGLARDLYVQMLLYCKETMSDGWVPVEEVGVLAYPLPLDRGNQLAKQLASVGLIEEETKGDAEGWRVIAYLHRNRSRSDIEKLSRTRAEAGRKGGRPTGRTAGQKPGKANRNQVGKQNESRQNPEYREQSTETDKNSPTESSGQNSLLGDDEIPGARSQPKRGRKPKPGPDPLFDEWYDAYPVHKARGAAEDAWTKIRDDIDPQVLISAAKRYAVSDLVRRGFGKHPATWLNQKCWLDEDTPPPQPSAPPSGTSQPRQTNYTDEEYNDGW